MTDELAQGVIAMIADIRQIPLEDISLDSSFEDLGIDSLGGLTNCTDDACFAG